MTTNFDASLLTADEKNMGMLAHLAILSYLVTGIGMVLGPLIVWLMKKDESAFVDENGKEALNFGISVFIWTVIGVILTIVVVGIFVLIALAIAALVLPIVGAIKAKDGVVFRYPLTFRLIK